MDNTTFENLVNEIRRVSMDTLTAKNAKYATGGDRLHNFVAGGDVMGGTAAQACWGYLTKHLVALRDKVERNDFSDREDLREKCQDAINYIVFLWCIGNEERAKQCRRKAAEDSYKGLGLSPKEREAYGLAGDTHGSASDAHTCAEGTAWTATNSAEEAAVPSYLYQAEKLSGHAVSMDDECPADYFKGAPDAGCDNCPRRCAECWHMPYEGERPHDNISGD